MTTRKLYPFPRLTPSDIVWLGWSATLDGEVIEIDDLADRWDAISKISFEITARINRPVIEAMGITAPVLTVTAACADTAYSMSTDALITGSGELISTTAKVDVAGHAVSQMIDLRADVVGKDASASWLSRRILAQGPQRRVPLDSDLIGFPTSSSSFETRGLPAAPWRLRVTADSLEAPFVHSVNLELNVDYPSVRRLINSKPDAQTEAELNASITRVLIATVSRLWGEGEARLEHIAAEHPDSIVAAAQRAAEQRAALSVSEAVKRYRLRPEELEYAIASRQRILGG